MAEQNKWVEFQTLFGMTLRVDSTKVLAIYDNGVRSCKVVGKEWEGNMVFIDQGLLGGEDASGPIVRGTLDEVQAKLDGTYTEEPN